LADGVGDGSATTGETGQDTGGIDDLIVGEGARGREKPFGCRWRS